MCAASNSSTNNSSTAGPTSGLPLQQQSNQWASGSAMDGRYFPADDANDEDTATYEDLSYSDLVRFPDFLRNQAPNLKYLKLDHNDLTIFSDPIIPSLLNLVTLDLSNNRLKFIGNELLALSNLKALILRNNQLDNESLPKDLGLMQHLELVNLSGNQLLHFPMQLVEIKGLKYMYLGANHISRIPGQIQDLQRLKH